jgi:hypothetical protein
LIVAWASTELNYILSTGIIAAAIMNGLPDKISEIMTPYRNENSEPHLVKMLYLSVVFG